LVLFSCQRRAIGEIVPDPTTTHDKDYFKCLRDFGGYLSRNIALPILVIAELRPADTCFCSELLLRDPDR
jgi:hypothetical protein